VPARGMVPDVGRYPYKSTLVRPSSGNLGSLALQSRVLQPGPVSMDAREGPVRKLRRRVSPVVIEGLVARYDAGGKTPVLSREYGVSTSGLLQLLLAEGVWMRRQAMTPEDAQRAVRLHERGKGQLSVWHEMRPVGAFQPMSPWSS